MDTASLQDQFSRLQEEQQKKFARLKAKQSKVNAESDLKKEPSFGVSDDLNLNSDDVTSSSSVGLHVTLEAANTAMREELRELHDETGRLRKSLAERDYEIKKLNKKISKCEDEKRLLSGAGIASDSASVKIVDLSKKTRELTSQVESEKSKNFRLQQKVTELERKYADAAILSARSDANVSKAPRVSQSVSNLNLTSTESMENLQDQLNAANLKASEYRNQVQALKQDMKVALKILCQETGENHSNIQALLGSSGQGFRGRAQQVIALQSKVKELEQKLKTDLDLNPKVDKNLARIKNMERSRKEQNDALKEDLIKVHEQCTDIQRKLDATKARNKVLMSEIKSLKSQISVLNDKGSHDNELIDTLMKQQEGLQKLLERNTAAHGKTAQNEAIVYKELHNKTQQESSEIKRVKQLLTEREAKVAELEKQVAHLENQLLQATDDADSLNGEGDHKPLSVFNSSTQINTNGDSTNHATNGDAALLGQKCVELKALYETSEIERQHLTRMVATLNARIEESRRNIEETTSAYHDTKRMCVSLEQKLETLKPTANPETARTSRDSSRNGHVVELEAQLSIQKDENNALKEALESTLRNKRDDATMYQEMTQQTKQVFLDALRSFSSKQARS